MQRGKISTFPIVESFVLQQRHFSRSHVIFPLNHAILIRVTSFSRLITPFVSRSCHIIFPLNNVISSAGTSFYPRSQALFNDILSHTDDSWQSLLTMKWFHRKSIRLNFFFLACEENDISRFFSGFTSLTMSRGWQICSFSSRLWDGSHARTNIDRVMR